MNKKIYHFFIIELRYLLTINIINYCFIKSFLIFPIEYLPNENYKFFHKETKENSPEEIFQQIYYRNIFTKIKIGSPPKSHIFLIETNKEKFYISSIYPSKINNKTKKINIFYNFQEKELYDEESSFSYKEIICSKAVHLVHNYSEICIGKENIVFNYNNKTISKDFPIKVVRNNDENIPGTIGLIYNHSLFNISRSLITELRTENMIDNYYWFLDFDEISLLEKKIKGNLVIGGLPHEIFPFKYSIGNFNSQNAYISSYVDDAWRIKIDNIYLENNSSYALHGNMISFSYEIYHIIGTFEFHKLIKGLIIDSLIEEKKCFLSNFSQNIYTSLNMSFYYCYKYVKDILYDKISFIKFFSFELSYIFELTKEELFYIKDDYIYFNILFCEKEFNYWLMGQIFTTKYNFVFNTDKKQIGFYKKNNNIISNKQEKENNKALISFIIIFAIIFMCLGLILGKKIVGIKRKHLINELIEEQNYEYRAHNNVISSNDKGSNYKARENKKKNIFEMYNNF